MLGVGCSMVTALVLLPALLHVLSRDQPMSVPEAVSADIDRRVAA
jgi:hypothetical protein